LLLLDRANWTRESNLFLYLKLTELSNCPTGNGKQPERPKSRYSRASSADVAARRRFATCDSARILKVTLEDFRNSLPAIHIPHGETP
jgi:hypothetical protein